MESTTRGCVLDSKRRFCWPVPPSNSAGNPLYRDLAKVVYTRNRPTAHGNDQFFHKALAGSYEDEHRAH